MDVIERGLDRKKGYDTIRYHDKNIARDLMVPIHQGDNEIKAKIVLI